MPFIITGIGPAGRKSVTRTSAASAIVLAIKWDEAGIRDVQIAPPGEAPRRYKLFQAQQYRLMHRPEADRTMDSGN